MGRLTVAAVVLAAFAVGCSAESAAGPAIPACPTYREVSGVYVLDGEGQRPCLIPPSTPGPTLSASDYGVLYQQPSRQPSPEPWVTVDRAAPRQPLGHH